MVAAVSSTGSANNRWVYNAAQALGRAERIPQQRNETKEEQISYAYSIWRISRARAYRGTLAAVAAARST